MKIMNKLLCCITVSISINACSNSIVNNSSPDDSKADVKSQLVTTYKSSKLIDYIETNLICKTGNNEEACNTNKANLESQFNFSLDQIKDSNSIKKIKAYSVIYQSSGLNNEDRTLSGGVLVPDTSLDKIKGVVLFFHPTEVSKFNVPSCFYDASNLPGYCKADSDIAGSNYAMELGGIFATQGYIVVMPDYIGQGIDSSTMHPYVAYPQINAKSSINMLKATRQLLDSIGYDNSKLNLYITGYSEGGAYALWASRILQNSSKKVLSNYNYNLSLTAPISGAYDLANTQVPMEFANITGYPNSDKYRVLSIGEASKMKPIVSSYLLTSLAYYNLDKGYLKVFSPDFIKCLNQCSFSNSNHTIVDLYTETGPEYNTRNISSSIIKATFNSINPDNDLPYSVDNNSISSITSDSVLSNKTFIQTVKKATIVDWKTKSPVTFITYEYDSIVSPLNTDKAYDGVRKLSDKNLVHKIKISNFDYYTSITSQNPNDVKPIDHMGCRVFPFIAALNEFNNSH